ncbi:MAG: methylmalonyl-CoA mutase, partial [Candidatus Eremiobacteraeota bacterium]|nr:methylmalonyl-CoA mutase [Candidatus Eremiobacteraeota bacterium]
RLTQELIERGRAEIAEIDAQGGAVAAIESGWMQDRIADSAYRAQQAIERGEQIVVAVNRFADADGAATTPIQRIDTAIEREQSARLRAFRQRRNAALVTAALDEVRRAAEARANLVPLFVEAVDAGATLGEICGALRAVFGTYRAAERIA